MTFLLNQCFLNKQLRHFFGFETCFFIAADMGLYGSTFNEEIKFLRKLVWIFCTSIDSQLADIWGKNDEIFVAPGAEAFKRDLPDAEIHLLDTGHFALETHGEDIASLMLDFLGRKVKS